MRPVMHTVWGVPLPDLHEGMRHVRSRHLCPRVARGDAEPPVVPTNGKRICGVNRNADGAHYETVTLVTHARHPLAIRCCRDASGETAALLAWVEDASRIRKGHALVKKATLDKIVLAVVFHRGFRYLPGGNLHFMMRRNEDLDAILSPT